MYPLPTERAGPVGISAGRDWLWFVEILAGQVGRIAGDGKIEQFPLPDRSAKPHAVVATPDGGCWVTLSATGEAIHSVEGGCRAAEAALWRCDHSGGTGGRD